MQIIIYVLCFNDASEIKARRDFGGYSWARPLRIETTLWLEGIMYGSWLMAHEAEWASCDFVGTIAYSIFSKIPLFSLGALHDKIKKSDIFAFYKRSENLISTVTIPHFRALWVDMLSRLGFTEAEALDPTVEPFYCNYWIARPAIMREYCDFYRRAQGALAASALQSELWSDSGYSNSKYSNADWCQRAFGVPYYPHHVFLMERLPCFFAHKRYRVETVPNILKSNKEKIVYLVLFNPLSESDSRNQAAIAAYASMFSNIKLLSVCTGTQNALVSGINEILVVQSTCAIDILLDALSVLHKVAFDYIICSQASVALDLSAMPILGGVHYSGPVSSGPHIWGGCLALSKVCATILLGEPLDKSLPFEVAIGSTLGKFVLPYPMGSIDLIGAAPTGAYCYVQPSASADGLEHLVAQFERPAICVPSQFDDDPKNIATNVIRDLFASAIASVGDLSAAYSGPELLDRLGLPLHYGSRWSPAPPVLATEAMVLAWLRGAAPLPAAINLRECELSESRDWLRAHIRARAKDVRAANPFRARYGNNNDVFVCADDSVDDCTYERIKLLLNKPVAGFLWKEGSAIATKMLAEFPNLVEFQEPDLIRMLQFASTCGVITATGSDLSALLEALAFESKVWELAPGV